MASKDPREDVSREVIRAANRERLTAESVQEILDTMWGTYPNVSPIMFHPSFASGVVRAYLLKKR